MKYAILLAPSFVIALLACDAEPRDLPSAPVSPALQLGAEEAPRFSDWSAPVNLGAAVNSAAEDMNPTISRDGLTLYFTSPSPRTESGPNGWWDLWTSSRTSADAPWGAAEHLGTTVNAPFPSNDNSSLLSRDGHWLFFASTRPDGFGGNDLYVSRRRETADVFTWGAPENLGSRINSSANEAGPTFFEDEETGAITFYFNSNRAGGLGGNDIYSTTMLPDGGVTPPVHVAELSSGSNDQAATVRRDGLEIFFASNRPGGLGGQDIWVATRATTSDPWSTPVNLGPVVNSVHFDSGPELSFDGATLYFHSAFREGNIGGLGRFDIVMTSREKLTGAPLDE